MLYHSCNQEDEFSKVEFTTPKYIKDEQNLIQNGQKYYWSGQNYNKVGQY